MTKLANFTRHYPRQPEIQYWRDRGYSLDPTPRAPSLDETWGEQEIAGILVDELSKIKAQGFQAVLIGGLTNVMAYAWYIAQRLGLQVLHARGGRCAMSDRLVRCFQEGDAIGMVPYTDNLDYWDGHNWTCGSTGRHLGIGKTKDGRFYVCHGSQWEGERDYAEIISEDEAKKLVLRHNPDVYEEIFGEPLPIL